MYPGYSYYPFPPSPPPSSPHTVAPSLSPADPELPLLDPLPLPSCCSPSHTVQWRRTAHRHASSSSAKMSPRKQPLPSTAHRALTLPSHTSDSSFLLSQNPGTPTRRFSSSSGSSASSATDCPGFASQPLPSVGIRRKVADSLQLFKESTPLDIADGWELSKDRPSGQRRHSTSYQSDSVGEAKYEFVKRADWPDPETAAIRRERSSTALERVKPLEAQQNIKEQPEQDGRARDTILSVPLRWRRDTISRQEPHTRGRRRERLSDVPCIRPPSRGYPRSPSTRRPLEFALCRPCSVPPTLTNSISFYLAVCHANDLTPSTSRSSHPPAVFTLVFVLRWRVSVGNIVRHFHHVRNIRAFGFPP